MRNGSSQSIALLPELRAFRLVLIITMHSGYYILYSNYALVTANCVNRASDHWSVYRWTNERIFFLTAHCVLLPLINNLSQRGDSIHRIPCSEFGRTLYIFSSPRRKKAGGIARNAGTETPTEFSLCPCNEEYEEGVSSLRKYVRRGLLVLIKSALSTARVCRAYNQDD